MRQVRTIGRSVAVLVVVGMAVSGCGKKPQETSFPLQEISAFDVPEEFHRDFILGQGVSCQSEPDPNVAAYPPFVSEAPLFGRIHLPKQMFQESQGHWYSFAADESNGTGQGYDRLYFDLNADGNLTDDEPVGVWDEAPAGARVNTAAYTQETLFDCIDINLPFGTEGTRPLEVMPRLVTTLTDDHLLSLVTRKAFRGTVTIAGHDYEVWLGHGRHYISGWFDEPSTALYLVKENVPSGYYETAVNRSMEWRRIGGIDYRLSGTPSGDRLIVSPYQGAYGTLKARSGMSVQGDLYSGDALVRVGGKRNAAGGQKPVRSCRAPVGNYYGEFDIHLGDMLFSTSGIVRSDEKFNGCPDDDGVPGIQIRRDKPFVLGFRSPRIWFTNPEIGQRVACGNELVIQAILVDVESDMYLSKMQRSRRLSTGADMPSLWRATLGTAALGGTACLLLVVGFCWKSKRRGFLISGGLAGALAIIPAIVLHLSNLEVEYEDVSPTVAIARSDGEIVATGTLPFG